MVTRSFADLPPTDIQSDDKLRITLPTAFANQLKTFFDDPQDIRIHLTVSLDGCIVAYPPDQWNEYRTRLENDAKANLHDEKLRRKVRRIIGSAAPVVPDKQGRVKLPNVLCVYAGIEKSSSVCLAGFTENFEIWDSNRYQRFLSDDPASPEAAKSA